MIDHLTLAAFDYEKSKEFIKSASANRHKLVKEFGNDVAGFGIGKRLDFWLASGSKATNPIFHLAFVAQARDQVDAFFEAALVTGGKDNGKPGIGERHSPNYYAAFVLDPDGQKLWDSRGINGF